MTIRDTAEAVLNANPYAFIHHELGGFGTGLKGEYLAVCDGDGRELLPIDRATSDQLARQGVVQAGPFDPGKRTYVFRQRAGA